MSIGRFLFGGGKIAYRNSNVSIEAVREALENKYKIVILEESVDHIKCKIVRRWRLYGGPHLMMPHSRLNLIIKADENATQLYYDFRWPEYYEAPVSATLVGIISMVLFIDSPLSERIFNSVFLFFLTLSFFGFLIFLDTKYVAYRVRRILVSL